MHAALLIDGDERAHQAIKSRRIAVRSEPHRLALVVVRTKSAELGPGLVERAQRHRKNSSGGASGRTSPRHARAASSQTHPSRLCPRSRDAPKPPLRGVLRRARPQGRAPDTRDDRRSRCRGAPACHRVARGLPRTARAVAWRRRSADEPWSARRSASARGLSAHRGKPLARSALRRRLGRLHLRHPSRRQARRTRDVRPPARDRARGWHRLRVGRRARGARDHRAHRLGHALHGTALARPPPNGLGLGRDRVQPATDCRGFSSSRTRSSDVPSSSLRSKPRSPLPRAVPASSSRRSYPTCSFTGARSRATSRTSSRPRAMSTPSQGTRGLRSFRCSPTGTCSVLARTANTITARGRA